jgi:hypothetical protein
LILPRFAGEETKSAFIGVHVCFKILCRWSGLRLRLVALHVSPVAFRRRPLDMGARWTWGRSLGIASAAGRRPWTGRARVVNLIGVHRRILTHG